MADGGGEDGTVCAVGNVTGVSCDRFVLFGVGPADGVITGDANAAATGVRGGEPTVIDAVAAATAAVRLRVRRGASSGAALGEDAHSAGDDAIIAATVIFSGRKKMN